MDKPFWKDTYKIDNISTFGTKPNKAIEALWHTFDKKWAILDVGCGEGKNPIFLAEKGFSNIDAFDISQAGVDKLRRIAFDKKLTINAWVDDLTTFRFPKIYDLIISYGTFHFIEKLKWKQFINKSKQNTNRGGLNIFHIFTDKVPASYDIAPFIKGLAYKGELKELYTDWEIKYYDSSHCAQQCLCALLAVFSFDLHHIHPCC